MVYLQFSSCITIIELEFHFIEIHFEPGGDILQVIDMGVDEMDEKVGNTGWNRGIGSLICYVVVHGEQELEHVFLDMGTLGLLHLLFGVVFTAIGIIIAIATIIITIHGGIAESGYFREQALRRGRVREP
jgi:hypothetical protein